MRNSLLPLLMDERHPQISLNIVGCLPPTLRWTRICPVFTCSSERRENQERRAIVCSMLLSLGVSQLPRVVGFYPGHLYVSGTYSQFHKYL